MVVSAPAAGFSGDFRFIGGFLLDQNPLACTVHIVILAAFQRPEERYETGKAEEQSDRQKINQNRHACLAVTERAVAGLPISSWEFVRCNPSNRSALPITSNEEPDMAIAAIRGVAWPRMAIGTAMTL